MHIGQERPGALVVSLDFELYWGLRDVVALRDYRDNLLGVRRAIPAMLDVFERFQVHATWATVGFLFARDRDELLASLPARRPRYVDDNLSPYPHVARVGSDEAADPFHFAPSLIAEIAKREGQEIASHTFSHYYCMEAGQTVEDFGADLIAARDLARARGHELRSLVLPRNQWDPTYAPALTDAGIRAVRLNRSHVLHRPRPVADESLPFRALRLLDSYLPLSGDLSVPMARANGPVVELEASAFLRPVGGQRPRRRVRVQHARLERGMRRAAEAGRVFHLWWHPHNFGTDLAANLASLEALLETYVALRDAHGMRSLTMSELAAHTVSESQ